MDILEHMRHELRIHATEGTLGTTLVQDLVVTVGLQHRHIVLLLILSDLTTHTHTLRQQLHQLVVELVDLLTQLTDTLRRGVATD